MADISKLNVNNTTYDIKDTTARSQIADKQDALTFDSAPTEDSTNPVTSGGVKTALATKQDAIADLTDIRSGATAGSTAVQPAEFEADQQRQETEIGAVANAGAKNLLKVTASSGVLNTATIDIAGDGSIHITGQPTRNGAYVLSSGIELVIPENAYILSIGAEAGNTKMSISLRHTGTSQYVDLYRAESRIIPAGTYDRAHIYLYADTVYDTHVYPMIRPASITDDTFIPYAKTNRELTVAEDEDRAALIALVDSGAKNLFNINATPIVNHTTYALTDEKLAVSASGTWAHYSVPVDLPEGDYTLSMMISDYSKASGAPDTSMRLRMAATTSGGESIVLQTITGNGTMLVPFTWNGGTLYVQFYSNYNATSYANSFSAEDVMICTAADYAISPAFVPYAPTNRELYETCETKVTMQQAYGEATAIPANSNLNDYTTPGLYYALVANVSTITSTPYTATGLRLVVEKNTPSSAAVFQTLYPTSRARLEFYRRIYEGGSWSSWYKFEGTVVS